MQIEWAFAAANLIAFAAGMWFGERKFTSYLIDKAEPKYRTAVHMRGRFYYLMPETEYNRMPRHDPALSRVMTEGAK